MTLLSDWPVTLSSLGEASISYPQQVIRRLVREYQNQSNNSLSPFLNNLIFDKSPFTVTALSFTVFVGLLIAVVAAMSWRDTFNFFRRSPSYSSSQTTGTPQVNDGDFSYLTEDDIVEPPRAHYVRQRPQMDGDYLEDSGPDILRLQHRGVNYPLHFDPYAIDDGALTVGDLRRRAAENVGTSDLQRIRLLYKGKLLRDDAKPCKEEGLKQQSLVMCVVLSESQPGESTSDFSGSEIGNRSESMDSGVNEHHQGGSGGGTRRDRKSKRNKKNKKKSAQNQKSLDSVHAHENLAPPSDARPTSSGRSSAAPSPAPSLQQFSTGNGQVEALLRYLRTELAPAFDQYLAHPPTDPKVREYEHKRLGEMILTQVIMKADSIDSEEARTARRALIKEAQGMLNELDAAAPQDKS